MSLSKGYEAEAIAGQFLVKKGLTVIARNYRCKTGEIDLICRDKDTIVFVEVRSRAPSHFASAKESVTLTKQQRIIRTAHLFLLEKKWTDAYPCRFDVIAFEKGASDTHIEWVKKLLLYNAFICYMR